MTQDRLAEASRDELIDIAVEAHRNAEHERTRAEHEKERRVEVEQQLEWFKKQLFGQKSERRLVEPDASQLNLGEGLAREKPARESTETVAAHQRRKRAPRAAADEPGLRFDDSVPVETIVVPNPELEGLDENDYVEISEKISYRLAQQPASYTVLKFVRRVVKRADTGALSCPPAPPSVLPGSYADVSLLAGLLVDKLRYHLPLYRQHQRMQAAGITVSRSSLSNWVHQAVELLEPIYEAQLRSVVASDVLAMDETPI